MEEEQVLCQPDLSAEKKTFSRIGFSLFFLVIFTVLFQIIIVSIIKIIALESPKTYSQELADAVLSIVPMYLMAFPCTLLLLRKVASNPIEKRGMGAGRFFRVFVICMGIMVVGGLVGHGLADLFGRIFKTQSVNFLEELILESSIMWRLLIFVVAAPLAEEFLFRKVLIEKVIKYGEGTAILLSALFFALLHGNLYQFFYAFGLGAVFAYVYIKTGKLRYPVILHMIINFLGSIVAPAMINLADSGELQYLALAGMFNFAFSAVVIAGIVLFFIDVKKISLEKGVCILPKGKRFSTTLLNAGTISYLVLSICIIALSIAGIG